MVRIKCWRSVRTTKNNTTYINDKSEKVYIMAGGGKSFVTNIEGKYEGFDDRKKALTFAKKYMREHC
ncbi:MAG: hypothetical protein AABY22_36680 [Nanoarchaeota archaeon]